MLDVDHGAALLQDAGGEGIDIVVDGENGTSRFECAQDLPHECGGIGNVIQHLEAGDGVEALFLEKRQRKHAMQDPSSHVRLHVVDGMRARLHAPRIIESEFPGRTQHETVAAANVEI